MRSTQVGNIATIGEPELLVKRARRAGDKGLRIFPFGVGEDLDEGLLRVTGKGGKMREVPVVPAARRAVDAYLALCPHPQRPDDALFLAQNGSARRLRRVRLGRRRTTGGRWRRQGRSGDDRPGAWSAGTCARPSIWTTRC